MARPHDYTQRQRALDVGTSFLVRAPAGSGKTELLIQRALACLARVERPEQVLVLTFTNKAVNEARGRLIGALERACNDTPPAAEHALATWSLARTVLQRDTELGWSLLQNPARLRVITLDKLNAQLAAQLPLLSGIGGAGAISENPELLYRDAVRNMFDELNDAGLDEVTRNALVLLLGFCENRTTDIEPLLVELLKTRDQWLGQLRATSVLDLEHVIGRLVTSRLLRARHSLGDGTTHRLEQVFAQSPFGNHAQLVAGGSWPSPTLDQLPHWQKLAALLLTKDGKLRRRMTVAQDFPAGEPATIAINELLSEWHTSADTAKFAALGETLLLPDAKYPERLDAFRAALAVALERVVAHLHLVFEARGVVDFIEVSLRALVALGSEDSVGDVLLRQDYLLSHILLDEGQDTSATQYQLLRQLVSGWTPGDGRSLFVVGDTQQSIYSFREADVGLFQRMWSEHSFGDLTLECLTLSENFRSEPEVVDWFNNAFSRIFPTAEDAYSAAVTFSASTASKPRSNLGRVCAHGVREDNDGREEADLIIGLVKKRLLAAPDEKIAVLVRNRGHIRGLIPALRDAGVEYSCQEIDPLLMKAAVTDAVCLIRALWHPMDRTAWVALLRAPFVGLSWSDCVALVRGRPMAPIIECVRAVDEIDGLSDEGRARLERVARFLAIVDNDNALRGSLRKRAQALWYALGGAACVSVNEHRDVDALFSVLEQHCTGGELDNLEGFMAALNKAYATPETGRVEIMTIHKAKGLEFDTVIIPGLARSGRNDGAALLRYRRLPDGYLFAPHPGDDAQKDSPEARLYDYLGEIDSQASEHEALRLLYVAITRARKQLHLIGTLPQGTCAPRKGSFLHYLWPVIGNTISSITPTAPPPVHIDPVPEAPKAPRIDLRWLPPTLPRDVLPKIDIDVLPSELVLRDDPDRARGAHVSVVERVVGVLYHGMLERIGNDGLAGWDAARVLSQRNALVAACRSEGVPGPMVAEAVENILSLVNSTLNCRDGRWILGSGSGSRCELRLAGFIEGLWVAAVIDRMIVSNGVTWVVDYKTSDVQTNSSDTACHDAAMKYRPQLQRYVKLMQLGESCGPIGAGIFFPSAQRFVTVIEPSEAVVGPSMRVAAG